MVELERIVCPVDLSELSLRPLAYAGAIANWYDAPVTALHVVPSFEPMEVRAGALFDPVQFVYPMPREQVLKQLRQAVHAAALATDNVELAAEAGEPVATIVDQALARRADLARLGYRASAAESPLSGLDGAAPRPWFPSRRGAADDSVSHRLLIGGAAGRWICG